MHNENIARPQHIMWQLPISSAPVSSVKVIGALVIADGIKPEAPVVTHILQRMGLRVMLLTGDNRRTARAIAAEVSAQFTTLDALNIQQ